MFFNNYLVLSKMHMKINNIFGSFSSIPTPSRPQDTGNWIQFWVIGLFLFVCFFVSCDSHLTCICVCILLRIILRLTPTHWSQNRDMKRHRAVETTSDHFIQKGSKFFWMLLAANEASICCSRYMMSHFLWYLRAMCDILSSSLTCLLCLFSRWTSEQSFVVHLDCVC